MNKTDERLNELRQQIERSRRMARTLRLMADGWDKDADELVKECAALGTGTLPLMEAAR